MALQGCREGKATPKLTEVKCPICGGIVEVFVKLGGDAGVTGTLTASETCPACGHILEEGTPVGQYEQA